MIFHLHEKQNKIKKQLTDSDKQTHTHTHTLLHTYITDTYQILNNLSNVHSKHSIGTAYTHMDNNNNNNNSNNNNKQRLS